MKNEKKTTRVFLCQKYGKFWSILLEPFIKHKPSNCEECFFTFEDQLVPPIGQFFGQSTNSVTHFLLHTCYSCSSSCCELFVRIGIFIFCFSSFSVSFHTTQKSKGSVLVLCYNICLVTVKWFRKVYIVGDFMNER